MVLSEQLRLFAAPFNEIGFRLFIKYEQKLLVVMVVVVLVVIISQVIVETIPIP